MAIKKQYLKSKPVCKVTFSVPAKEATKVAVVGDFNELLKDLYCKEHFTCGLVCVVNYYPIPGN